MSDPAVTEKFWNQSDITDYFALKPPDPRIVDYIAEHFPDSQGLRALDLGCGGGRHTELLARRGFEVSAVDIHEGMLRTTESRLAHLALSADIQRGSILDIPHGDEVFDVVITTGVLHQARGVDEYGRAITELARVMKPGGVVLLNIFTDSQWDESYVPDPNERAVVTTAEGLQMTLLSIDTFTALMNSASFELTVDYGEDVKLENTGPRSVYRAAFTKL